MSISSSSTAAAVKGVREWQYREPEDHEHCGASWRVSSASCSGARIRAVGAGMVVGVDVGGGLAESEGCPE